MAHLCARNTLLVKLGVIARQPSLCLAVNTIFKHFGSNTVEFPPIVEFPMSATIISAAPIGDPAHSRRKLFRFVLFSLSAILAAIALAIPTRADESRTLIIPPNDGYGFEECLKTGSQCGLVVADAWCKAHGYGASKSFGPEADGAPDAAPGSFEVKCGDSVN
jgi:hypothetical protein